VELDVTKANESRTAQGRLARSCALLAILIAPVAVLIAAVAARGISADSLTSAAVGGGVCWLAAALALTTTYLGNRFQAPVPAVLGGMVFRMGLPLAAILMLPRLGGPLAATGVTTTILGVYLVALVIETLLAVRMVPPQAKSHQTAARPV